MAVASDATDASSAGGGPVWSAADAAHCPLSARPRLTSALTPSNPNCTFCSRVLRSCAGGQHDFSAAGEVYRPRRASTSPPMAVPTDEVGRPIHASPRLRGGARLPRRGQPTRLSPQPTTPPGGPNPAWVGRLPPAGWRLREGDPREARLSPQQPEREMETESATRPNPAPKRSLRASVSAAARRAGPAARRGGPELVCCAGLGSSPCRGGGRGEAHEQALICAKKATGRSTCYNPSRARTANIF